MRKALVVGINYYENVSNLYGCVNDALSVKSVLERHGDDTLNFDIKLITSTGPSLTVLRKDLKEKIREVFADEYIETALFYFSGHGYIEPTGGYLCTSECEAGDDGVPLNEVLTLANESKAQNKIIILDCCHSGIAGSTPSSQQTAVLTKGLTILAASTEEQYAKEVDGSGLFTTLFVDALNGAAANLVGDITPGSAYAHIDQSLGSWDQRPVFKTNIQRFVSLRKVQTSINLEDLRLIKDFFPTQGSEVQLDPSWEPEREIPKSAKVKPDPENTKKFAVLQKYNRVNLVVPVGASKPNMWHAAMEYKPCKLTALGEHYRRLVERKRI